MRYRPEQRLRLQNDIRAVREKGQRSDSRYFTLWTYRRPADFAGAPASTSRATAVASIAAIGNAVSRNRAKRRLREVFRRQQHIVPPGCDLLIIARTAIKSCTFSDLEQTFTSACARLRPAAHG